MPPRPVLLVSYRFSISSFPLHRSPFFLLHPFLPFAMGSASDCSEFRSCLSLLLSSFLSMILPLPPRFLSFLSVFLILQCRGLHSSSMLSPASLGVLPAIFASRPSCAARTVTLLLPSLARSSLLPFSFFGVQYPYVTLPWGRLLFHRSSFSPSVLFDTPLS